MSPPRIASYETIDVCNLCPYFKVSEPVLLNVCCCLSAHTHTKSMNPLKNIYMACTVLNSVMQ